jgi:hypothetical protein
MFIMRTYTKKVRAVTVNGRAMIQAGPWIGVKEFVRVEKIVVKADGSIAGR